MQQSIVWITGLCSKIVVAIGLCYRRKDSVRKVDMYTYTSMLTIMFGTRFAKIACLQRTKFNEMNPATTIIAGAKLVTVPESSSYL